MSVFWFYWIHLVVAFSIHWSGSPYTSKSEAMVFNWKRVACPLWVRDELLLQVKEFKYLWVSFTCWARG